jgi:mannose/fructose-specific phosphotransferase system component IIA
MIAVVVITHGLFGEELVRTAEGIVGRQEAVAALTITSEVGLDHVSKGIDDILIRLKNDEGYLFLVDMMGGTPCNTALLKTKNLNAEVVTGVNLYMLLSSFTQRNKLNLHDLAVKVAEDGRKAIVLPKDMLLKRLS